jgi:hypothetical protein
VRNDFAATNQVATSPIVTHPAGYEIAQAVPQDMITNGANTNSIQSVIWTIWNNNLFTNVTTSGTNTAILTATMPSITTSNSTLDTNVIWTVWNSQLQATMANANSATLTANISTANTLTMTQLATVWGAWNAQLQNATPEQVAEAQRRHQEQTARHAQVQVERTAAEKRAEKLLQDHLSPKQREELAANRFFTVASIGKDGQRRTYRIHRGRSRNVQQVDASGRVLKTLCAHPAMLVPDPDTMLAQKLMLESQEEDFLRIANHS